jgi:hypothetical protein
VARLAHLHHHVVREIDQVVDRTEAHELEPVPQPGRGRADLHVQDPGAEPPAQVGGLDVDAEHLARRRSRLPDRRVRRPQREPVERGHLAGHPEHVHAVDAVRGDVELEDGVPGHHLHRVHGEAGGGEVLRQAQGLGLEGHVLAEPGERELHPTNCSRKRRSFS